LTIQDIFIVNLKTYRKLRHISQAKLAELCDSSTGYIGEIESGKRFPSVNMIERIANALKIESWYLFMNKPISSSKPGNPTGLSPTQKNEFLQMANTALSKIISKF